MRRAIDTRRRDREGERRADRPHLRLRLDPLRPRRARCCTGTRARTALGDLGDTTLRRRARCSGGASGGTIDSLRGQIDEAKRRPAVRADRWPTPTRSARTARRSRTSATSATRWASSTTPELGGWHGAVRDGHRSTRASCAAATRCRTTPTAASFRYRELMLTAAACRSARSSRGAVAGGIAGARRRACRSGRRASCSTACCPTPARGRARRRARTGFFKIDVHSITSSGAHLVCDIKAQRRSRLQGDGRDARRGRAGAGARRRSAARTRPAC